MGALISDASPARFVPVLGFAILSLALLLFYFIAVRPRRGTTEWFSRVGTRPFTPLRCEKLCWTDIIWCILSADLGAALSVLAFFPLAAEVKAMLLPAGICAVCYVALRLLGADALSSGCSAVMLPVMLPGSLVNAGLVLASLAVLLLWLGRDPKKGLLPAALLLPGFTLLFGAAVLREHRLLWLAPVYAGAYVFAQAQRWHFGREKRGRRLLLSLFLTALTVAVCAPALYAGRLVLAAGNLSVLNARFFPDFLCKAQAALAALPPVTPAPLRWRECYLLLYAAASVFPVLHGLIRQHQLRCAALLLLPLPFLALRFTGGSDLLALALPALPAWTLTNLGRRWRGAEVLCVVMIPLFYIMELLIP